MDRIRRRRGLGQSEDGAASDVQRPGRPRRRKMGHRGQLPMNRRQGQGMKPHPNLLSMPKEPNSKIIITIEQFLSCALYLN